MDLLGSPPTQLSVDPYRGTNGKTPVAHGRRASPRCTGAPAEPPLTPAVTGGTHFDRRQADASAQYVATYREIEPLVALIDQQSQASAGKVARR